MIKQGSILTDLLSLNPKHELFLFWGYWDPYFECMGINISEQKDLIKGHTYNKGNNNNQFSYAC